MAVKPSAVVDTRVIYCGDNLEQLKKLPTWLRRSGLYRPTIQLEPKLRSLLGRKTMNVFRKCRVAGIVPLSLRIAVSMMRAFRCQLHFAYLPLCPLSFSAAQV
jgi:hypothetical protein